MCMCTCLHRYSLEVYLFSIPLSVMLTTMGLPAEDNIDGHRALLKFVHVEAFVVYQLVLWIVSAAVAELVVAPATEWARARFEQRQTRT